MSVYSFMALRLTKSIPDRPTVLYPTTRTTGPTKSENGTAHRVRVGASIFHPKHIEIGFIVLFLPIGKQNNDLVFLYCRIVNVFVNSIIYRMPCGLGP